MNIWKRISSEVLPIMAAEKNMGHPRPECRIVRPVDVTASSQFKLSIRDNFFHFFEISTDCQSQNQKQRSFFTFYDISDFFPWSDCVIILALYCHIVLSQFLKLYVHVAVTNTRNWKGLYLMISRTDKEILFHLLSVIPEIDRNIAVSPT